ncbi:hypothetical protein ACNKHQ_22240 [Shigella flexneri]
MLNLTPDKQHSDVVKTVMPLMKQGAARLLPRLQRGGRGSADWCDITVVMVAPKCPGTEVREKYKRGFGVPTLIAATRKTIPRVRAWPLPRRGPLLPGGDRAGVLDIPFVAEVKSDLMGEQTILCGMLQALVPALLRQVACRGH